MQKVVIACVDQFGLEVFSLIQEVNHWYTLRGQDPLYSVVGFLCEKEDPFGTLFSPIPFVGKVKDWKQQEDTSVVMGIKEPKEKHAAVQILRTHNATFETIVGPWMLSYRDWLTIGEGSIVCPYSAKPDMVIGDFVTIISSMLSGHKIGNYSTVMRFANIAGASIGNYSFIGDHVFLPYGKVIGNNCCVESGSVVIKSIKDEVRVSGVPARKLS